MSNFNSRNFNFPLFQSKKSKENRKNNVTCVAYFSLRFCHVMLNI